MNLETYTLDAEDPNIVQVNNLFYVPAETEYQMVSCTDSFELIPWNPKQEEDYAIS